MKGKRADIILGIVGHVGVGKIHIEPILKNKSVVTAQEEKERGVIINTVTKIDLPLIKESLEYKTNFRGELIPISNRNKKRKNGKSK